MSDCLPVVYACSSFVSEMSWIGIEDACFGMRGDPHEIYGECVTEFLDAEPTCEASPCGKEGVELETQDVIEHGGENHGLDVMESTNNIHEMSGLLYLPKIAFTSLPICWRFMNLV